MPAADRKITPADILAPDEYARRRQALRQDAIALKKDRRMEVGPFATFHFENYASMWLQVMEMLRIEKGGPEQIPGEIDAYNPLIPQGSELIATLMLEIDDALVREKTLRALAGIEESVFLDLGGERIKATPTEYEDRTTPDGKTSSVHWVRLRFTAGQIARFKAGKEQAVLGIAHPNYGHMAAMREAVRQALAQDFA
ncbi:MAG: DUF3501 family protein [Alphaproteobacteria bacterium]|nr:DUF3501 family protein [Alphaproteobacteria bacterium]